MMLCRCSLAWHRYVEATEASVPSHSLLLWRACISHRSTTNTSGRQPLRRGRGTYHHPCSSSTRLMLDSSSIRLTSSKSRIVGSGRICGSTSCYLKLDQCRLGLLVVYMWFSVQCSSEQLGTPNNYFIIFSSETKNCLLY